MRGSPNVIILLFLLVGERRKKVSKVDSFELPNYPDEESKKKALDSAMKTELDFLEFAEVTK
jgi:hypothetical protein